MKHVNCELLIIELHLLAKFTHKVTLPFLNCIEVHTRGIAQNVSKLHCNLLNHDMDTLQDFQVNNKHVTIPALAMEAEKDFDFELPSRQNTELHKLQPVD